MATAKSKTKSLSWQTRATNGTNKQEQDTDIWYQKLP